MAIDLIKALREVGGPDGKPAFQGTNEDASGLLAQAGLQQSMEPDTFLNTAWKLRLELMKTPEWRKFNLAAALLATAEDQNPGLEAKRIQLKASTTLGDGIVAIQLFSDAAKRQKAVGGL